MWVNAAGGRTICPLRRFQDVNPPSARVKDWKDLPMAMNIVLIQPIIALIAGILILVAPRLLNYIVAIYLIIIGVSGLIPH